jgi:diaminopimelate epimerase
MLVCVSPILSSAEETFCSLNFAARVRTVELGKATKQTVAGGTAAIASAAAANAKATANSTMKRTSTAK